MAGTDDTFDLPINAGQGAFGKDQTTFGVTIKGYFEIVAPAEGNDVRHPGSVDGREPTELTFGQVSQFSVREHAHCPLTHLPRS